MNPFHFIWKRSFEAATLPTRLFWPSKFHWFFPFSQRFFLLITVKCLFNWNFISKQSMKEEFRFFLSCFCCHFTQPTATGVCMFFFRCFHCFVSFSRYFFSLSLFCVFSFLFFFLRIFCFRSRWHCWHRYQRMFSEHYTKIDKRNGLSENVFVNWNRKLLQTKCDHFNCH